jgi:hypothetical protein
MLADEAGLMLHVITIPKTPHAASSVFLRGHPNEIELEPCSSERASAPQESNPWTTAIKRW